MIKTILLIALGGALGSLARFGCVHVTTRFFGTSFPWGTLGINVVGSLLIGVVAGYVSLKTGIADDLRSFVMIGFLGGFTTFSAFSLDAIMLWEKGDALQALGYVMASVILSILAAFSGLMISRNLFA